MGGAAWISPKSSDASSSFDVVQGVSSLQARVIRNTLDQDSMEERRLIPFENFTSLVYACVFPDSIQKLILEIYSLFISNLLLRPACTLLNHYTIYQVLDGNFIFSLVYLELCMHSCQSHERNKLLYINKN